MEFSQYRYISTVAFRSTSRSDVTIRSKRWKDASFQLGFHLAKHFTPTHGVKTADNNFEVEETITYAVGRYWSAVFT